ncbi:MAG: LacI family DNA-binding transcriptional regulator [Fimbriimonadaceae bacterium]|nr:LacI family DNA-binding transcriptional regulator [Fimbriimonadaceae bacterium]
MRVTQQDIARISAVSQATVSRVLAGDSRVEPETRDRVLAVIEESNYQPDVRAQSLRTKRTNLIGIVLQRSPTDATDDPFIAALITEITHALSSTKYHLCIDIANSAEHQSRVYDELLRTRRIDGLLLVEPEKDDPRLTRLQKDDFPFVVIGNPKVAAWHSVDNDNVMASRMATLHLIEEGHPTIAFLCGPKGVAVSDDRVTGYQMAMHERGLKPAVLHCDFGHDAAFCLATDQFESGQIPSALLVMDDFMATGVIKAAGNVGVSIPDQMALASFNNSTLCGLIPNGLTSVNMNLAGLVQRGIEKLIQLIENGERVEPSRYVVPCELVIRGSSRRRRNI